MIVASLFLQMFALVTPIFFQLIVDKVLVHKGLSTLVVLTVGMVSLGLFETVLQFLRSYTLSHTTNRVDVELGRRLFHHLFRLPLAYFETRAAGQTVARVRELETIRSFLTGQGLTSLLDLVFTVVFFAAMFIYSVKLTLIVLATIPVYILIAAVIRPPLRELINEQFNRGARSQQFLVESIVGAQTLKAASVEPQIQAQWEERLAAYVSTSFDTGVLGSAGQNAIQYVSKIGTALILFIGAEAVIDGAMTVGELIAFNMIAGQVVQPILRLSQLWQDFQQVQVSVARLGDILNSPPEPVPQNLLTLPPPRGAIDLRNVTMRYRPDAPDALRNINLSIRAGEVIGFVGPSGSGNRVSPSSCSGSTARKSGRSCSTASTSRSSIPGGCAARSAWCCKRTFCSTGPSTRISRSAIPPMARARRDVRRASSPAPTNSFPSCHRATIRSSKSAAPTFPAGSANASRSRGRWRPTRAFSFSTKPPRRSIMRASASFRTTWRRSPRAARCSSSPIGSRRSGRARASSVSCKAKSSRWAATRNC